MAPTEKLLKKKEPQLSLKSRFFKILDDYNLNLKMVQKLIFDPNYLWVMGCLLIIFEIILNIFIIEKVKCKLVIN